ncbi:hypothetical protein X271_00539 [Candidatus Hepatoplasma crinochetorum Av]|uniref:Uncharacterized protein n=1 Tax=Candidatus Hepatoplasma crinochetorum Av TaxID=1427984 RepID=W8GFS7_9MOLU|nr:hypothetical protein [Candidatus Hepatoplasma crinochetorum]AHK22639.1 hypothetical protein X271_00539 [Candidatus Hepatoplasma crinochetorum Av]
MDIFWNIFYQILMFIFACWIIWFFFESKNIFLKAGGVIILLILLVLFIISILNTYFNFDIFNLSLNANYK